MFAPVGSFTNDQNDKYLYMKILVFFGKPGAGKGTQADLLKAHYNLVHISTGELFRYNMKNQTDLGKLAQSYMDAGDLVPDQVTIDMLEAEVDNNPNAAGFIFDGFPRTFAQAEALDRFLAEKKLSVSATIALEADDDVLVERLLKRGETSGRSDDQDETKIRNRFAEYNDKTAPLKSYYQSQGKFYTINGIGSLEAISQRLKNLIDGL